MYEVITNISYEIEFYLSEQLGRMIKINNINKNNNNIVNNTINDIENDNVK